MALTGYYCPIPKWDACQIGWHDTWVYQCALCRKELKGGDWVLVSQESYLILCGVMDRATS